MSPIPESFLVFSLFAFMFSWRMILEPETDDHIIEAIEEIVQTYEKKLSLYDLLAHFPIDHNIVCPESDIHLSYPGDCTRYITCRDFKAHIRGCPPGMKFDKKVLRCRYAYNSVCNESLEVEKKCGSNEVYLECSIGCEKTCDEFRNDYIDCPEECTKGCFCKEGFVRGPLRNCIPPRKCGIFNPLKPWFLINSTRNSIETLMKK
ncbi:UNVERIFIED_CONTAM: hypothetical protein NCL1_50565 [Trichonephila clavipes]